MKTDQNLTLDRKHIKRIVIGSVIFIVVIVSLLLFSQFYFTDHRNVHKKSINGRVSMIIKQTGGVMCKVEGNNDYYIFGHTQNDNYTPSTLFTLLEKGDSILKRANSDTLMVYKNNQHYLFVLGKSISKRSK